MLRGRGRSLRSWGAFLLLMALLLPVQADVRADGPGIAPLPLPIGPGKLTNPRVSGTLLVWQDTTGVFGIDLGTGKALPIPAAGASEPDVAGSLVVWKQGTNAIGGLDLSTGTAFTVPVGDAKIFGPSVTAGGVVAWLALDTQGAAVRAWDRATGATYDAGRIPASRLKDEFLAPPRASGRRIAFPDVTTDPARASRMIVYDLDADQRLAVNEAFTGPGAAFDFAQNRLALAQGSRILIYDFDTNAVEAVPTNVTAAQQVTGIAFDGATVVWSTSPDAGGNTAIWAYALARRTGYGVASNKEANAAPAISGGTIVWARAGGLAATTIPAPDPATPTVVRADLRYFPQTGYVVGYAFLTYYNIYGGAQIFGYPLTNEVIDAASALSVQYFERSRFEYHPENKASGNIVQLTNVGRIIAAGRTEPAFVPQPVIPGGTDRAYFVQSQHSLGGLFKKYFDTYGGVAVFGFPISEETIEPIPTDGVAYTVQYFERARFEFHPEGGDGNAIVLGQLGRQLLLGQVGLYKPQCSPLYIQKPLLPECR